MFLAIMLSGAAGIAFGFLAARRDQELLAAFVAVVLVIAAVTSLFIRG